jgi:hypothetical protein
MRQSMERDIDSPKRGVNGNQNYKENIPISMQD